MSEKTEQPTAKKLRDARKKGQVAKSKDLTQTLQIVAIFGYLIVAGGGIAERISAMFVAPNAVFGLDFADGLNALADHLIGEAVGILMPFVGIVLVFGIFGETMQTGIMLAFEALKPSAKKLNVLANAKNMVSKKNLIEFLKSLFKVCFLSVLVALLVRDAIPYLTIIPAAGLAAVGLAVGELLRLLIINVTLAYVVVSFFDFAWQRFCHNKELMMSKDEVKQEYKEMEGDPHIKQKRKHLHQEMLAQGAVQQAKKATVVVTNPTHLAIALHYEKDETPLPVVLAKGEGALAEAMIAAAREAGVPVLQNIPLAHALFDEATAEQYIPSALIEPVAEVLRLVQKIAAGEAPGDDYA